jgi:hypothetical protein
MCICHQVNRNDEQLDAAFPSSDAEFLAAALQTYPGKSLSFMHWTEESILKCDE